MLIKVYVFKKKIKKSKILDINKRIFETSSKRLFEKY